MEKSVVLLHGKELRGFGIVVNYGSVTTQYSCIRGNIIEVHAPLDGDIVDHESLMKMPQRKRRDVLEIYAWAKKKFSGLPFVFDLTGYYVYTLDIRNIREKLELYVKEDNFTTKLEILDETQDGNDYNILCRTIPETRKEINIPSELEKEIDGDIFIHKGKQRTYLEKRGNDNEEI